MRILLVICFALAAPAAHAISFSEKCPDIPTCARTVAEMLGHKYVFDADVTGKMLGTPNVELTRESAEHLFTNMLNANGYTRVPLAGQPNTWQLMRQRDARDSTLPSILADAQHAPELPDNWDLYTLRYKATNPDSVEFISRLCRSFMPANSRIIPAELSGMLVVTDTAVNLKKLYPIVVENDRKISPALRKKWEEEAKARAAERKANPPPKT